MNKSQADFLVKGFLQSVARLQEVTGFDAGVPRIAYHENGSAVPPELQREIAQLTEYYEFSRLPITSYRDGAAIVDMSLTLPPDPDALELICYDAAGAFASRGYHAAIPAALDRGRYRITREPLLTLVSEHQIANEFQRDRIPVAAVENEIRNRFIHPEFVSIPFFSAYATSLIADDETGFGPDIGECASDISAALDAQEIPSLKISLPATILGFCAAKLRGKEGFAKMLAVPPHDFHNELNRLYRTVQEYKPF